MSELICFDRRIEQIDHSDTLLKLVHVVPSIAKEASGPSYSVRRLCSELTSLGTEIHLATLGVEAINSGPAFLRQFPRGFGPSRLGRSPALHSWLGEQCRLNNIDILHNHSLWMMPNVYPGWVSQSLNVPLVVSPRGTLSKWAFSSGSMVKKLFWPLLQQPAIKSTACFHATSASEYEDIRRMGFRQPVSVVPNGIDIGPTKKLNQGSTRTLLYLGRIHPIKGLENLLRAWRAVENRFKDWRLEIIGPNNGGHLETLQTLQQKLRLKRLCFRSPAYGERKWQAYRKAELFVLPTHSENFGMTVAESLAAGTPAIVTKGAPWQGLETHQAGWWVDIGVDPLVSCFEEALECSQEELQRRGLNGQRWMQQDFSWSRIGAMMLVTYEWLLNGGEHPAHVRVL